MNIAHKIKKRTIKHKAKYNIVLKCFNFFESQKAYFTCKLQALFVNYVSFLNLQGSTYTTFKFKINIYNINGYLKTLKNANRTDIFICKELLSLQKIKRSLALHPKPK